jgi:hypothetical protein
MTKYEQEVAQAEELQRVRDRIQEALSRYDTKSANKHYAEEMRILAKLHGNAPIVGAWGKDRQRTA